MEKGDGNRGVSGPAATRESCVLLQVYHHAAVVPMAWLWCECQQSLQWGGLLFNTLVHVAREKRTNQYPLCETGRIQVDRLGKN